MKLADAKKLRDEIKEVAHWHCIVPLGFGPDRYFARIYRWDEEKKTVVNVDFYSRRAWLKDLKESLKRQEKARRKWEQYQRSLTRRCSPIEIMIDRACGLE